jgi:hypothetical protein
LQQPDAVHRKEDQVQEQNRIDSARAPKIANQTLLKMATTRSGTIVLMQNVAAPVTAREPAF